MASNTPRLDLLKKDPLVDGSDTFNIKTMMNDNWDKIDSKVATLGPDGKVPAEQLNVDTSSLATKEELNAHLAETKTDAHLAKNIGIEDTSALFTAVDVEGALKEAIEKANSAFTSASNGKQKVGNAITGVDSSINIPTDPTFEQLAEAVSMLKTAKEAEGQVSYTQGAANKVTGLAFTPDIVVLETRSSNGPGYSYPAVLLNLDILGFESNDISRKYMFGQYSRNGTSSIILQTAHIFPGGFNIPDATLSSANRTVWKAWKIKGGIGL